MRKIKRAWMTLVGAAGLTVAAALPTALPAAAYAASTASPAVTQAASSALPDSTYSPGTSTPHKPVYNSSTGKWDYYCSYAHWRSGAKVVWHCNLYMRDIDTLELKLDQSHSGSWTPGSTSYTTPKYHKPLITGDSQLCTGAWALSVDGGTSIKYACN